LRPGHAPPESKPPHSITPRWARSALRSPSRVQGASAPTESPKRFPRRPSAKRDSWPWPAPTSAAAHHRVPSLSVWVAATRPRRVKAAQEVGRLGAGALVLALTGVVDLHHHTGGSFTYTHLASSFPGWDSCHRGSFLDV